MVDVFGDVPDELKEKMIDAWREMSETEKTHFVNQVALALSIWGNDIEGNRMVVRILELLARDGCNNLVDFGLYIEYLLQQGEFNRQDKVQRAYRIIEGYRLRNELPSEPHKEIM